MSPLNPTCCVCLEGLIGSGPVSSLPCGHVFHRACASQWISQHTDCPLCRKSALPSSLLVLQVNAPHSPHSSVDATIRDLRRRVMETEAEVHAETKRADEAETRLEEGKAELARIRNLSVQKNFKLAQLKSKVAARSIPNGPLAGSAVPNRPGGQAANGVGGRPMNPTARGVLQVPAAQRMSVRASASSAVTSSVGPPGGLLPSKILHPSSRAGTINEGSATSSVVRSGGITAHNNGHATGPSRPHQNVTKNLSSRPNTGSSSFGMPAATGSRVVSGRPAPRAVTCDVSIAQTGAVQRKASMPSTGNNDQPGIPTPTSGLDGPRSQQAGGRVPSATSAVAAGPAGFTGRYQPGRNVRLGYQASRVPAGGAAGTSRGVLTRPGTSS